MSNDSIIVVETGAPPISVYTPLISNIVANQGAPGNSPWPVSIPEGITISGIQTISGDVGTLPAAINVGQTTISSGIAVQIHSGSILSTNGILLQAISVNLASIFVGGSSVTVSTGWELQPGQCVPFTCANINTLYIIGSNNIDAVCWNVL
jgi:hypothetical protein